MIILTSTGSGTGFVRASYASSLDNIERALERLERFMVRNGLINSVTTPQAVSL